MFILKLFLNLNRRLSKLPDLPLFRVGGCVFRFPCKLLFFALLYCDLAVFGVMKKNSCFRVNSLIISENTETEKYTFS